MWASLHVFNHADRHPLRTIPQYLVGLIFGTVYVKFGLTGALLTHFGYDAIIWGGEKQQKFNWVDIAKPVISALVGTLALLQLKHPLTDLTGWFSWEPVYAIPDWSFWDYVRHFLISGDAPVDL